MCKTMEANTPSYRSFWRFYYNKKQQVKYMLEHIYNFPYNRVLYSDAEIWPMWEQDYFWPIIALMICHEDLQLKKGKLAIAFFRNLPAYCLNFVHSFFAQVYNNKPRAEYYHPKDVKPIFWSVFSEERYRIWNRVTAQTFFMYRSHMSRTSSSFDELLKICLGRTKFENKYKRKTGAQICGNLDVLSIYREALRVNLLLEKKQLPVLLTHR
jgi:hypothetical protein